MSTTSQTSLALTYRLLFDALVEIRARGCEQNDKVVFRLADLFHNAVLDLKAAAEGDVEYNEVLSRLEQKAGETRCGQWSESAVRRLEAGS